MSDTQVQSQLPRIEDFQSNYTPEQVLAAETVYTRAIAMQAYLYAFPAFLHMRQLTEFIQGRKYFAPGKCPLGGWVLMRDLATPKTTTVSPNVDTLYGASYLLLDKQGPVVLSVPPFPAVITRSQSWMRISTISPLSVLAPLITATETI